MDAIRRPSRVRLSALVTLVALFAQLSLSADEKDPPASKPIARLNNAPITAGDLEFTFLSRRIPPEEQGRVQNTLLDQLIDRRLMAEFLKGRNAKPSDTDVSAEVDRIRELVTKAGNDPAVLLPKLGYTDDRLRAEVALPLAWMIHARRAVTDMQMREFWEKHREEYDGTQVRGSQIFLKVAADGSEDRWKAAEDKLASLRTEITSGKSTFAAAAAKHSEAPSRTAGGDIGFFPYRGKMPPAFGTAAFPLKMGEISQPFRTPFGVHIVTVTDRKPGDLSLEDARPRVFDRLQQQLWDEIVRDLRAKAKIEKLE